MKKIIEMARHKTSMETVGLWSFGGIRFGRCNRGSKTMETNNPCRQVFIWLRIFICRLVAWCATNAKWWRVTLVNFSGQHEHFIRLPTTYTLSISSTGIVYAESNELELSTWCHNSNVGWPHEQTVCDILVQLKQFDQIAIRPMKDADYRFIAVRRWCIFVCISNSVCIGEFSSNAICISNSLVTTTYQYCGWRMENFI